MRFRELRTSGPSELCWQACLQEPPLAVLELQSFCMILKYIFLVRGTISSTQELGLHQIADFLHFAHASRHSMHPFRLSGTFRPFLSKGKLIYRPSSPVPSSPHAFRKRSIGASLASSPAEAYLFTDRELQRFWCLRRALHYARNCGLQKLRSSFFGLMPLMFFMLVMFLMLFACTLF